MNALILDQPRDQRRKNHPLRRLLNGEPVALRVDDPQMRTKSRYKTHTLFMVPIVGIGEDGGSYALFALDGYGARVLNISDISVADLYMVGLSLSAAKLMVREFNDLYTGDGEDGNEKHKQEDDRPPRPKRRRRRKRHQRKDETSDGR
mgnify:CR=1 FL=1